MKSNTVLPKDKASENNSDQALSTASTSTSTQAVSANAKPKTLFNTTPTDSNPEPKKEMRGCPACGTFSFISAPGKK